MIRARNGNVYILDESRHLGPAAADEIERLRRELILPPLPGTTYHPNRDVDRDVELNMQIQACSALMMEGYDLLRAAPSETHRQIELRRAKRIGYS